MPRRPQAHDKPMVTHGAPSLLDRGPVGAPVVIVGGGIAGLAAAWEASRRGLPATVIEARRDLGGRTSSWCDRTSGRMVDTGQHVLLGCCTALRAMLSDLGLSDLVHIQPRLSVSFRSAKRCGRLQSSPLMPGDLHASLSLLAFPHLSIGEKRKLIRGLFLLKRVEPFRFGLGGELDTGDGERDADATASARATASAKSKHDRDPPADPLAKRLAIDPQLRLFGEQLAFDERSFGDWLRVDAGQPKRVIERFWDLLTVATCNASVDQVSAYVARFVFRTSFWGGRNAPRIGWSRVPLGELCTRIGDALRARGVTIRTRCKALSITTADPSLGPSARVRETRADGTHHEFVLAGRGLVLATPLPVTARLLDDAGLALWHGDAKAWDAEDAFFADHAAEAVHRQIAPHGRYDLDNCTARQAAIVGVNLWYDRRVMQEPFAALIGTTAQWVFDRAAIIDREETNAREADPASPLKADPAATHGVTVSISAADSLVRMPHAELIAKVDAEIRAHFKAARQATLVAATVVPWVGATVVPGPGQAAWRPHVDALPPRTGITLAGGDCLEDVEPWPPTMENAVRTGIAAVARQLAPYTPPKRPTTRRLQRSPQSL